MPSMSVALIAAVAGQCVDPVYAGILSQFFYNGVLTAASADYQNIHPVLPPIKLYI